MGIPHGQGRTAWTTFSDHVEGDDTKRRLSKLVAGVIGTALMVSAGVLGFATVAPSFASTRPVVHTPTSLEVAAAPLNGHVAGLVAQRQRAILATVAKIRRAELDILLDRRDENTRTSVMAVKKEISLLRNLSRFFWPTEGTVTSGFGWRIHPVLRYRKLHNGADIPGACSNPIYAAQSGKVVKTGTGYSGGSGNNMRIDHGTIDGRNIQTAYLHMTRFIVKTGEYVNKGEVVGYVGTTGLSTRCHLHLSLYKDGVGSDPLQYVKK